MKRGNKPYRIGPNVLLACILAESRARQARRRASDTRDSLPEDRR